MQRCEQALVAKIRDYYLPLLLQHDDDLLAVGYKREALAETRFLVLSEVGDLRDASILEAGCGVGNLLAFLKRHGYAGDYTGIDLMPEMIERARLRHPEARFEVGDFNAVGAEIGADYVLASGVYQHAGHEDFLRSVETMFSACRIAAAFNMFSLWCPPGEPQRLSLRRSAGNRRLL